MLCTLTGLPVTGPIPAGGIHPQPLKCNESGAHLLLKLVQLEGQQVVELEVGVGDVEVDLGGVHQLLPVTCTHRRAVGSGRLEAGSK